MNRYFGPRLPYWVKAFSDYPGASQTVVIGITGGDVVGGYATPATPGVNHGFLWSDGEFTSVDSAPGASFTNVTDRCAVPPP